MLEKSKSLTLSPTNARVGPPPPPPDQKLFRWKTGKKKRNKAELPLAESGSERRETDREGERESESFLIRSARANRRGRGSAAI